MNDVNFSVGDKIIAVNCDYKGLSGIITDIKTGKYKETDNEMDDIYCCLELPKDGDKIIELEKRFSRLYGCPKKIDELALDEVILSPEMLKKQGD